MITLYGFSCRLHGISIKRCCNSASAIVFHPKDAFVKSYLAQFFPYYFPVNWEECFAAMITKYENSIALLVDKEENLNYIVLDSCRWFDDQDVAKQFLTSLSAARLRRVAQKVRAVTNLLAVMRKPLVRNTQTELLRQLPKPDRSGPYASNLDRGFTYANLQYDGWI